MPSQYRIEISPNNRAVCRDTLCKKAGEKILKGTIRFGTWTEIKDHASWMWKHWGCVSGAQVASLRESCDPEDSGTYDFDAIDGFDELNGHPELQEKIRRCVKQGHIDAEDFKGDPEKNFLGVKGIHLTEKQKALKEAKAQAPDESEEEPKKKKRSRKSAADDEDEPQPKKVKKAKASKPVKAEDDEEPALAKAGRPRKSASKVKEEADEENAKPVPAKSSRKSTGKVKSEASDDKPSRRVSGAGTKAAAEEPAEEEPKSRGKAKGKRSSTTKNTASEPEPAPTAAKRGRGRPSKSKA